MPKMGEVEGYPKEGPNNRPGENCQNRQTDDKCQGQAGRTRRAGGLRRGLLLGDLFAVDWCGSLAQTSISSTAASLRSAALAFMDNPTDTERLSDACYEWANYVAETKRNMA